MTGIAQLELREDHEESQARAIQLVCLEKRSMSELEEIQHLYDRNLFQQAYRRSARYWRPATDVSQLSVEELILGGRLAWKLGGFRLSRWLLRTALGREPSHPRVRYFTSHIRHRGWHLFDDLRAFEERPELEGDNFEIRAWRLAEQAVTWARLRDFDRAAACLDRARSLTEPDGWALHCESEALCLADRWPEALETSERAWQISGAASALQTLCDSLAHLGRLQEAAERARAAAEGTESFEIVGIASGYLCALAETLGDDERVEVLRRAIGLVERLSALAPLADREARSWFARARLEVADLSGNHQEMARWAEEIRSPFHRRVAENLRKNPKGSRILLPFRRVQQKHMACVPASISAALAATGVSLDADEIAAAVTYGGTASWAAAEWLEKRGLAVRFFVVNPGVAASLIQHGIPFVLSLTADDAGHAVAAIGLDEAAGTLLIHDPSQIHMGQCLLQEIRRNGGPLDPEGMAIVPPDRAALVDRLLSGTDAEVADAHRRYAKAQDDNDLAAQRGIVDELAKRRPLDSGTRCLRGMQANEDGHSGEALAVFQQLLHEFPNSAMLRRLLLSACRASGNLALVRQALEDVVDRGIMPGVQSGQDWSYPPATYVWQYAEYLHPSAATRKKARALLNSVIDREGTCADAWRVLGDLLWHTRDRSGTLLCYRLASCLASNNENYAQAYSTALHAAGREEEALQWLEKRVRAFGGSPLASGPWISWIGTLENFGHPERALAACREGLHQHGGNPQFLAFATSFFALMGHWEESGNGLSRLEEGGQRAAYCEAAAHFHAMQGELERAIQHSEEWSRNFPHHIAARAQLLDLVAKRSGARAAVELAGRWLAEWPKHDRLEELYYWRMDRMGAAWKQDLLLTRRVKRNPEDAWAWQQLALRRLVDYNRAEEMRRQKLHPRILGLLAECDRTAPDAPRTLQAHALWAEFRGQWAEAVTRWLNAIDEDPGAVYNYQRLWECSATMHDGGRRQILTRIEAALLDAPGRVGAARDLLFRIADRFGVAVAEEAATRWRAARPDEPEVIEAAADLILRDGHSRAAATRAMALLEPAVMRFPYHLGLRFSLAQGHSNLGEHAAAAEALREIIRRDPGNTPAHIQLADIYQALGDGDKAARQLESAATRDPQNAQIWKARVRMLMRSGSAANVRAAIQEALRLLPEDLDLRLAAVEWLFQCQDAKGAVEAARQCVRLWPGGAAPWRLLAKALHRAHLGASGEIEACLRRSISADAEQVWSADLLAVELTDQGRYDEAKEVMNRVAPRLPDPSPARGRLAWIQYEQGGKEEALEALAAAVSQAPWYGWGWNLLMAWLLAEKKWNMALNLLSRVPAEMHDDADFRAQRISVLSQAGLAVDRLDAEWNELLRNFPEAVPHHLARYDVLRASRRCAEAAEVVRAIQSVEPDNVFTLARLVEVLCEEGRKDEALKGLHRIWFGNEQSPWPAEYAWTAVERAHFDAEAYQEARRSLAQGSRLTLPALRHMAAHAMGWEFLNKKARQPPWRSWLPGSGAREVLGLLLMVDRAPWPKGAYRSVLLRRLSEFGYQRLVARYADERPTVVDADVNAWSEVTAALMSLHRKRRARNLMANWRARAGVPMVVVVNYIACLSRGKERDVREIQSACKTALAKLNHDHCAKYLAHKQAEACALLGDREAFLQTWTAHKRYFTGELERSERFESEQRHLLTDVPYLAKLLGQNQTGPFQDACKALRKHRPLRPPDEAGPAIPDIPGWAWAILLWLVLQAIAKYLAHTGTP